MWIHIEFTEQNALKSWNMSQNVQTFWGLLGLHGRFLRSGSYWWMARQRTKESMDFTLADGHVPTMLHGAYIFVHISISVSCLSCSRSLVFMAACTTRWCTARCSQLLRWVFEVDFEFCVFRHPSGTTQLMELLAACAESCLGLATSSTRTAQVRFM